MDGFFFFNCEKRSSLSENGIQQSCLLIGLKAIMDGLKPSIFLICGSGSDMRSGVCGAPALQH